MSLISDLKSFASKVETAFEKLFHEAPSWLTIAQEAITYLGPVAVTITGLINPALGTEAATIIADIKGKLASALALTDSVANATSLDTVLSDLKADIPLLLQTIQVSNPTLVSSITNYTNVFITEIEAIQSALPAPSVATPAA